jgi:hypothetical protein
MDRQVHPFLFSASKSVAAVGMALLALGAGQGRVFAQTEAAPAEAAPAADQPAAEAAKPAAAVEIAPLPAPPAPPAPPVEWKVQSKGGLLITGGNSQSKNFTFGLNGFRKEGNNKLALEGGLAYGTSNNPTVTGYGPNDQITSVDRNEVTSTNNWASKGRYDRFLTEHNTAFVSGLAAADKIAGKTFFGGGQVGYSRLLLKNEMNIVVAELGYDFSYERYGSQPGKTLDPVAIHSARVLVGETLSLSKETGVTASVEALFNLNKEGKAINASDGSMGVDAFKDTRVNAKVGLSTNLWKSLSFGFSFAAKYDQNPAPRPVPAGARADASWPSGTGPNYWRLAYSQTWDTLTEATLLYTFF